MSPARIGPRVRVALAFGVGAVVVGLAILTLTPQAPTLRVPTSAAVSEDTARYFDSGAPAAVSAVRHGDLVCFFTGDARRDRLVFPHGYSASPDLSLLDTSGRVVVVPHTAVGIAFGSAQVTTPAACGTSGRARAVVRIANLEW